MRRVKRFGQAVVEFSLAALIIFFLLSASVDIALVFFALQGLHNAAQEGANYGSVWIKTGINGVAVLDFNGIRDRVRKEAGVDNRFGFVNLLDLNNNGTLDVTRGDSAEPIIGQSGTNMEVASGKNVVDEYIIVKAVQDSNLTGVVDANSPACSDPSTDLFCYIYVEVRFDYRPVFPLAPVFGGKTVQIASRYYMPMRSTYRRGDVNNTPTLTNQCSVPNMIGVQKQNINTVWTASQTVDPKFTSAPTVDSSLNTNTTVVGSMRLGTKTGTVLTAGQIIDCTSKIVLIK